MANGLNYKQVIDSTMASRFSTVMAAKLGTVGEYVCIWNKLLYPVVLDSFCERVCWGPLAVLRLGVIVLSVLALLSQFSELDCEDKQT